MFFCVLFLVLVSLHGAGRPGSSEVPRNPLTRWDVSSIPANTHTHSLISPWEDQYELHRMTRMTRPDCAVMCNLINTHTHREDQREWHRMTRTTRPDCAVMCNLINTHTHTHMVNNFSVQYNGGFLPEIILLTL